MKQPVVDLRLALAVWHRNLVVYRHTWKRNILPNFFEPLLYLVGMGYGLGAYLGERIGGTDYLSFIAPGLMVAAAMNGATFETTYNMYVRMYYARLYDAYLSTPAQMADVAVGELLWAITRALVYGVAFLVVLAGFSVAGHPLLRGPWPALLPLEVALVGAAFGALGELFTALIRHIDLYSYYYTLFITPLFLFSGIFFPPARFPHGETLAWCTPLYHAVRLARGLAQSTPGTAELVSAVWLVVFTLGVFALVPGRMHRQLVR